MTRFLNRALAAICTLLAALAWLTPAQASPASGVQAASRADLPFSVRITPAVLDWFNQVARPTDIASFSARDLTLLDQVNKGRKQVIFASAATAEQQVPALAGKIDIIGYDLEHWPQTPPDEQADPVAAVKRIRALADQYGLQVAVGPDRRFTADYGVELVPLADYYVLQLQRLQGDTQTLRGFADPLITSLRLANPDVHIIVQFNTGGTADDVVTLVDSMQGQIDAINLLTNPATLPVAKEIVTRLQSDTTDVSPTATPVDTLLPPETNPNALSTPVPMPETSLPALRIDWRQGVLAAGLALLGLIAAAALVGTVVFFVDRQARRAGALSPDGDDPPGGVARQRGQDNQ